MIFLADTKLTSKNVSDQESPKFNLLHHYNLPHVMVADISSGNGRGSFFFAFSLSALDTRSVPVEYVIKNATGLVSTFPR